MSKSKNLVWLALFSLITMVMCGCAKETEDLKISIVDNEDRPQLYLNQEYDVSLIINKEEGVQYFLNEVFYLDEEFHRQTIEYEGLKFTQKVLSDVSIEILAKKGKTVSSALVELDIQHKINTQGDEKNLLSNLTATGFMQTPNFFEENIKEGMCSIKLYYTGATRPSNTYGYLIGDGGYVLYALFEAQDAVYNTFSAYNEKTNSYKKDKEKTYAGFWVKNTTKKTLTVCLNMKLYEKDSTKTINYGCQYLSYPVHPLEEGDIAPPIVSIEKDDEEWHYYEMEITKLPECFNEGGTSHIRMSVCVQIENAEIGDVFYIDGFDVYHGSKLLDIE